jgi:hypothetical protein
VTIDELNARGVSAHGLFRLQQQRSRRRGESDAAGERRVAQGAHPYHVEIGGHCDERGSIGYNVAWAIAARPP